MQPNHTYRVRRRITNHHHGGALLVVDQGPKLAQRLVQRPLGDDVLARLRITLCSIIEEDKKAIKSLRFILMDTEQNY